MLIKNKVGRRDILIRSNMQANKEIRFIITLFSLSKSNIVITLETFVRNSELRLWIMNNQRLSLGFKNNPILTGAFRGASLTIRAPPAALPYLAYLSDQALIPDDDW